MNSNKSGIASDSTYYVDSAMSQDGDGSRDKPFRTISDAAAVLKPGDVCVIRAGTYRETIVPANSGTEAKPIIFLAQEGEKVVVSGCDLVHGWKQGHGNVYSADVTMERGHENQVFADGAMMWEARYPNVGTTEAKGLLEFETATMHQGTTRNRIVDPNLPDIDWTGASVWMSSHKRWYCSTGRITGFGPGFLDIAYQVDARGNHIAKTDGKYYVFGAKELLDSDREWYYDEQEGRLYVLIAGGGRLAGRVEYKSRLYAFDLSGSAHIVIRGIDLFAASIMTDDQSKSVTIDRVNVAYVYHSSKADEMYSSQNDSGLILSGANHVLSNSTIAYSSGNCVLLKGQDCQVINNHIHDANYMGTYAAALRFAIDTKGHVISHNTIERSGRSLVSTAGLYDSLFQFNDVGYAGYLTEDLGLTYGNGTEGGNSEIRYNWFHTNVSKGHNSGIYFDHGCKNLVIHHNVVWDIALCGLQNNQYANYILWYNNTVLDAEYSFLSAWGAAYAPDLYGCRLINNIGTRSTQFIGPGLIHHNNIWNYREFIDRKYPKPGTKAVSGGFNIDGITPQYLIDEGIAPYCGAYDPHRPPWKAGHDFDNPPTVIDTSRSLARYRNLISNPAFHRQKLDGWRIKGKNVQVIAEKHNQWVLDGRARMGIYSLELGGGQNSVEQSVFGLKPGCTYELMAMFRSAEGESAQLSVRHRESREHHSNPVTGNAPLWERRTIRFNTGADGTTVVISVAKITDGTGKVYVDDIGLQEIKDEW